MEQARKIVIRNKVIDSTEVSLNLNDLLSDHKFRSMDEFTALLGESYLVQRIYHDDVDAAFLKSSSLYRNYLQVLESGQENEFFKFAYKLNETLALIIDQHITICRIVDDFIIGESRIVPWYYIQSQIYMADSWWEEDSDIIRDFYTLPFIEFLAKYKMY